MKNFTLWVLLFISCFAFAQEKEQAEEKHKPAVMLGVSALKFYGYVGRNSTLNPMLDTRLGYFLAVEQRFGKVLGVEVTGLYGKLAGTDYSPASHANFQSQIMQGHVMLTANFDNVFKNDPLVSPFLNVGIGYMVFNSYTDSKAANGKDYNYWKDGSVRDQPDSLQYYFTAHSLRRDYNYETKLKSNNVTGCLVLPMGGGLNFHFGQRWTTSIGVNYTMCFTQWIDGVGKNNNAYLSGNVGLQYEFKSKAKNNDVDYSGVDFASVDHLDADKDGVPDDKDDCHGTPKGIKVDGKGCPVDTDSDGVPDYLDKEANTAKGKKVDGFGVTIDEKEIAKHQSEWNSLAPERSKVFNVAPSQAYLKKVEAESRKAQAAGNAKKVIPDNLKVADFNHDGFISAAEITETINAFFDGNAAITVDMINQLIEFFFE